MTFTPVDELSEPYAIWHCLAEVRRLCLINKTTMGYIVSQLCYITESFRHRPYVTTAKLINRHNNKVKQKAKVSLASRLRAHLITLRPPSE